MTGGGKAQLRRRVQALHEQLQRGYAGEQRYSKYPRVARESQHPLGNGSRHEHGAQYEQLTGFKADIKRKQRPYQRLFTAEQHTKKATEAEPVDKSKNGGEGESRKIMCIESAVPRRDARDSVR